MSTQGARGGGREGSSTASATAAAASRRGGSGGAGGESKQSGLKLRDPPAPLLPIAVAKAYQRIPARLTMWVPAELVPVLALRRPALRKASGVAAMDLPNQEAAARDPSPWSRVDLRGDARSVVDAQKRIAALCEDTDDVVLAFRCLRPRIPAIVGTKGEAMKRLSADHHCRVHIPPVGAADDTVTLEGEMARAVSCFNAMQGKIAAHGRRSAREVLTVPLSKFPQVIGAAMDHIPRIKARTGADIESAPTPPPATPTGAEPSMTLTVSGTEDAVMVATSVLRRMVAGNELDAALSAIEMETGRFLSTLPGSGSTTGGAAPSAGANSGGGKGGAGGDKGGSKRGGGKGSGGKGGGGKGGGGKGGGGKGKSGRQSRGGRGRRRGDRGKA